MKAIIALLAGISGGMFTLAFLASRQERSRWSGEASRFFIVLGVLFTLLDAAMLELWRVG